MRPVDKGTNATVFQEYAQAKGDLLGRLGAYCSYCERPCDLAVEHIVPKVKYPERLLDWLNFLLACVNCNGIKTDKDTLAERYLFPDEANTAHAFVYGQDGRVRSNPNLAADELAAAQRTLELVGLDRVPRLDGRRSDMRWQWRDEAWRIAEISRDQLTRNPSEELRHQITFTAKKTGFFSVWMTVFSGDADMKRRILDTFPGTRRACFDDDGCCRPTIMI